MDYEGSFSEYCNFCERRIASGNSIYCSLECQQEEMYRNANSQGRRASIFSVTGAQDLMSPIEHVVNGGQGLNYDYSFSAIENLNSATSKRAQSGDYNSYASGAHEVYKQQIHYEH